ncbi:MAG TPA: rhomboid family intramembrane serine protease [Marine Group III euryarchaeote]|uniref:Rhomboid family intramembrane serine protease n=1 Tax=Marine Group III euryarchaeote TaxID=2173149 RepID=A0A7J4CYC5_9ARCH|nr:rhomboid family intramembrane serine protease [Marine Group III euryarchaeote]
MFVGTLILVVVGLLVAYYCIRNEFMVSQSLVFINFAIFAVWAIMYRFSPQSGIEALVELGFRSMYLESPEFGLLTLISAMFMHGGPMHLLMNMLILILLGVPFEDRIGSRAFLRIYFISGIIGSLVTGSISVWNGTGLETINIGASGAVFGIMGGFALLYPRDEIPMLLGPIFMHRVPVLLATLVFIGMETLYVGLGTEDGIGHGTHMASFIAGVFLAPYFTSKKEVETNPEIGLERLVKLSGITQKGNYELQMIKDSDEPELIDAWLDKFWELQECPDCGEPVNMQGVCSDCGKDLFS